MDMLDTAYRALRLANAGRALVDRAKSAHAAGVDPLGDLIWGDGFGAVADVADAVQPGAGRLARGIRAQFGQRALPAPASDGRLPWLGFQRWLLAEEWGHFMVLGPKGTGKTVFMFTLARSWQQQTDYPVDAVNVYPGDVPDFATPRPSWWFLGLMALLQQILDPPAPPIDAKEAREQRYLRELIAVFRDATPQLRTADERAFMEAFAGRIVVIDELAALLGPPGSVNWRLVRALIAQLRHMGILLLMSGQMARQFPRDFLNAEALFFKEPLGDEATSDRDEPPMPQLWLRATAAYHELAGSPWRDLDDGDFADPRSWVYAYSRVCGYFGLCPFRPLLLTADGPSAYEGGAAT